MRLADKLHQGFDLTIHSEIPVSAGLSSSTALCIASIRALQQLCGIEHSTDEIAELSFQIERYDLDVECGRMDQYAIAYGGVTYIQTGDDAGVERLAIPSLPVLVADTQEAHDTQALQKWLRRRIADDDPSLMGPLTQVVDLVEEGREAILENDLELLGAIMNRQQELELAMGTSTDRLERFCRTARELRGLGGQADGCGRGRMHDRPVPAGADRTHPAGFGRHGAHRYGPSISSLRPIWISCPGYRWFRREVCPGN